MSTIQKAARAMQKIYMGIGIFAVGLMATCVIYAVIARYFFGVSHTFLEEFTTTVFAFTTFWGMGICILENEHVIIDTFFVMLPPSVKKWVTVFNQLVVLVILGFMLKYGWNYAAKFGMQISMGMRVPMFWMYGIIPMCSAIAVICILVMLVKTIMAPANTFVRKDAD